MTCTFRAWLREAAGPPGESVFFFSFFSFFFAITHLVHDRVGPTRNTPAWGSDDWRFLEKSVATFMPGTSLGSNGVTSKGTAPTYFAHGSRQTSSFRLFLRVTQQSAYGRVDQPVQPFAQPDRGRTARELLERIQVNFLNEISQQQLFAEPRLGLRAALNQPANAFPQPLLISRQGGAKSPVVAGPGGVGQRAGVGVLGRYHPPVQGLAALGRSYGLAVGVLLVAFRFADQLANSTLQGRIQVAILVAGENRPAWKR